LAHLDMIKMPFPERNEDKVECRTGAIGGWHYENASFLVLTAWL